MPISNNSSNRVFHGDTATESSKETTRTVIPRVPPGGRMSANRPAGLNGEGGRAGSSSLARSSFAADNAHKNLANTLRDSGNPRAKVAVISTGSNSKPARVKKKLDTHSRSRSRSPRPQFASPKSDHTSSLGSPGASPRVVLTTVKEKNTVPKVGMTGGASSRKSSANKSQTHTPSRTPTRNRSREPSGVNGSRTPQRGNLAGRAGAARTAVETGGEELEREDSEHEHAQHAEHEAEHGSFVEDGNSTGALSNTVEHLLDMSLEDVRSTVIGREEGRPAVKKGGSQMNKGPSQITANGRPTNGGPSQRGLTGYQRTSATRRGTNGASQPHVNDGMTGVNSGITSLQNARDERRSKHTELIMSEVQKALATGTLPSQYNTFQKKTLGGGGGPAKKNVPQYNAFPSASSATSDLSSVPSHERRTQRRSERHDLINDLMTDSEGMEFLYEGTSQMEAGATGTEEETAPEFPPKQSAEDEKFSAVDGVRGKGDDATAKSDNGTAKAKPVAKKKKAAIRSAKDVNKSFDQEESVNKLKKQESPKKTLTSAPIKKPDEIGLDDKKSGALKKASEAVNETGIIEVPIFSDRASMNSSANRNRSNRLAGSLSGTRNFNLSVSYRSIPSTQEVNALDAEIENLKNEQQRLVNLNSRITRHTENYKEYYYNYNRQNTDYSRQTQAGDGRTTLGVPRPSNRSSSAEWKPKGSTPRTAVLEKEARIYDHQRNCSIPPHETKGIIGKKSYNPNDPDLIINAKKQEVVVFNERTTEALWRNNMRGASKERQSKREQEMKQLEEVRRTKLEEPQSQPWDQYFSGPDKDIYTTIAQRQQEEAEKAEEDAKREKIWNKVFNRITATAKSYYDQRVAYRNATLQPPGTEAMLSHLQDTMEDRPSSFRPHAHLISDKLQNAGVVYNRLYSDAESRKMVSIVNKEIQRMTEKERVKQDCTFSPRLIAKGRTRSLSPAKNHFGRYGEFGRHGAQGSGVKYPLRNPKLDNPTWRPAGKTEDLNANSEDAPNHLNAKERNRKPFKRQSTVGGGDIPLGGIEELKREKVSPRLTRWKSLIFGDGADFDNVLYNKIEKIEEQKKQEESKAMMNSSRSAGVLEDAGMKRRADDLSYVALYYYGHDSVSNTGDAQSGSNSGGVNSDNELTPRGAGGGNRAPDATALISRPRDKKAKLASDKNAELAAAVDKRFQNLFLEANIRRQRRKIAEEKRLSELTAQWTFKPTMHIKHQLEQRRLENKGQKLYDDHLHYKKIRQLRGDYMVEHCTFQPNVGKKAYRKGPKFQHWVHIWNRQLEKPDYVKTYSPKSKMDYRRQFHSVGGEPMFWEKRKVGDDAFQDADDGEDGAIGSGQDEAGLLHDLANMGNRMMNVGVGNQEEPQFLKKGSAQCCGGVGKAILVEKYKKKLTRKIDVVLNSRLHMTEYGNVGSKINNGRSADKRARIKQILQALEAQGGIEVIRAQPYVTNDQKVVFRSASVGAGLRHESLSSSPKHHTRQNMSSREARRIANQKHWVVTHEPNRKGWRLDGSPIQSAQNSPFGSSPGEREFATSPHAWQGNDAHFRQSRHERDMDLYREAVKAEKEAAKKSGAGSRGAPIEGSPIEGSPIASDDEDENISDHEEPGSSREAGSVRGTGFRLCARMRRSRSPKGSDREGSDSHDKSKSGSRSKSPKDRDRSSVSRSFKEDASSQDSPDRRGSDVRPFNFNLRSAPNTLHKPHVKKPDQVRGSSRGRQTEVDEIRERKERLRKEVYENNKRVDAHSLHLKLRGLDFHSVGKATKQQNRIAPGKPITVGGHVEPGGHFRSESPQIALHEAAVKGSVVLANLKDVMDAEDFYPEIEGVGSSPMSPHTPKSDGLLSLRTGSAPRTPGSAPRTPASAPAGRASTPLGKLKGVDDMVLSERLQGSMNVAKEQRNIAKEQKALARKLSYNGVAVIPDKGASKYQPHLKSVISAIDAVIKSTGDGVKKAGAGVAGGITKVRASITRESSKRKEKKVEETGERSTGKAEGEKSEKFTPEDEKTKVSPAEKSISAENDRLLPATGMSPARKGKGKQGTNDTGQFPAGNKQGGGGPKEERTTIKKSKPHAIAPKLTKVQRMKKEHMEKQAQKEKEKDFRNNEKAAKMKEKYFGSVSSKLFDYEEQQEQGRGTTSRKDIGADIAKDDGAGINGAGIITGSKAQKDFLRRSGTFKHDETGLPSPKHPVAATRAQVLRTEKTYKTNYSNSEANSHVQMIQIAETSSGRDLATNVFSDMTRTPGMIGIGKDTDNPAANALEALRGGSRGGRVGGSIQISGPVNPLGNVNSDFSPTHGPLNQDPRKNSFGLRSLVQPGKDDLIESQNNNIMINSVELRESGAFQQPYSESNYTMDSFVETGNTKNYIDAGAVEITNPINIVGGSASFSDGASSDGAVTGTMITMKSNNTSNTSSCGTVGDENVTIETIEYKKVIEDDEEHHDAREHDDDDQSHQTAKSAASAANSVQHESNESNPSHWTSDPQGPAYENTMISNSSKGKSGADSLNQTAQSEAIIDAEHNTGAMSGSVSSNNSGKNSDVERERASAAMADAPFSRVPRDDRAVSDVQVEMLSEEDVDLDEAHENDVFSNEMAETKYPSIVEEGPIDIGIPNKDKMQYKIEDAPDRISHPDSDDTANLESDHTILGSETEATRKEIDKQAKGETLATVIYAVNAKDAKDTKSDASNVSSVKDGLNVEASHSKETPINFAGIQRPNNILNEAISKVLSGAKDGLRASMAQSIQRSSATGQIGVGQIGLKKQMSFGKGAPLNNGLGNGGKQLFQARTFSSGLLGNNGLGNSLGNHSTVGEKKLLSYGSSAKLGSSPSFPKGSAGISSKGSVNSVQVSVASSKNKTFAIGISLKHPENVEAPTAQLPGSAYESVSEGSGNSIKHY